MSDRTPADVLADWWFATDYCSQPEPFAVPVSESILAALAAAGYRVTPIPDDNTRALTARLRDDAKNNEDVAVCMGKLGAPWVRQATDLRAAAALLDGQPQDRPACPTCGWRGGPLDQLAPGLAIDCPDPWHVGGSGDTR